MEYTKGEWEIKIDKELACITIISNKGYKIATIHPFGAYREMPNAHLIAAAPLGDKLATAVLDANFDDYDNFLELQELAKKFKTKAERK